MHRAETPDATEALGRRLAAEVQVGDVILLVGDLGSGKTVFARGVATGLGVDPDEVSSPTFTLLQQYDGRLPVRHADLYRLERPGEVEDLDLDEAARDGVLIVEWAERLPWWPRRAWLVRLAVIDEWTRRIEITRLDDESSTGARLQPRRAG